MRDNGAAMRSILALLLLAVLQPALAVDTARLERGAVRAHGHAIPYRAIQTPGRIGAERLPLVVFLHGSGQVGRDDEAQLDGQANGALELVDRALHDRIPLVFVAPQDVDDYWEPEKVFELIGDVESRYPVDPRRIVLTGLSSGAIGVWDAMKAAPECFAAAVPMSGMTEGAGLAAIARVPEWIFHGDKDTTSDVERGSGGAMVGSREVVRELRAAGGAPKLTEYSDLGHVIWPRAYAAPGLLPWMLDQHPVSAPCDFARLAAVEADGVLQSKPVNSAALERSFAHH